MKCGGFLCSEQARMQNFSSAGKGERKMEEKIEGLAASDDVHDWDTGLYRLVFISWAILLDWVNSPSKEYLICMLWVLTFICIDFYSLRETIGSKLSPEIQERQQFLHSIHFLRAVFAKQPIRYFCLRHSLNAGRENIPRQKKKNEVENKCEENFFFLGRKKSESGIRQQQFPTFLPLVSFFSIFSCKQLDCGTKKTLEPSPFGCGGRSTISAACRHDSVSLSLSLLPAA